MKKVLFVCSLYHPHVGGIETMVTELGKFYLSKGIKVTVLTKKWPNDLLEYENYEGIEIFRIVSAKNDNDFFNVAKWLNENHSSLRADIVHAIGMRKPLPLIGFLLSRLWSVPFLATIAGGEIPNDGDLDTYKIWDEGKEIMEPIINRADFVTCVSTYLCKSLLKVAPNLKKIETMYAGIDVNKIEVIQPHDSKDRYILSLRRLIPSKGVDVLITAFKKISTEFSDIKLIIAGDGPDKDRLVKLVDDLNLQESVLFCGTVDLNEGISLLKSALCTVVPSISEGGGLVNIEAQAAGCPVIASRVGGIPEYVQEGKSGLLFESGNHTDLAEKIRIIINNDGLRSSLICNGKLYAAKFDWSVLGLQYIDFYNKMINVKSDSSIEPWSETVTMMWSILKQNNE